MDKQTLHHAYQLFVSNLRKLRRIAPVTTICMHGSPLSPFDNRELWKIYDYRNHGIIGEPYLDTDFSQVTYLTDTGRRWDGANWSVRDKVRNEGANKTRERGSDASATLSTGGARERWGEGAKERGGDLSERGDFSNETCSSGLQKSEITNLKSEIRNPPMPSALRPPLFHSTDDILLSLENGTFPGQVMLTVHPQRWNDEGWPWFSELTGQTIKNQIKKLLLRRRK